MIACASRFVIFLVIALNVEGMRPASKTCLEILEEAGSLKKRDMFLSMAKQTSVELGSGNVGKVYKIEIEQPIKQFVALKHQPYSSEDVEDVTNELFINKLLLGKKNIVQMLDYYILNSLKHKDIKVSGSKMYLLMELGDRSLEKEIKEPTGLFDSQVKSIGIFKNILLGLQAMHEKGIGHFDLNPKNVVFFKGQIKLVDFGNSRLSKEGKLKKNSLPADFPAEDYNCIRTSSMSEYYDIKDAGKVLFTLLFGDPSKFNEEELIYTLPAGTDYFVAQILMKCFTGMPNEKVKIQDLISLCDQATSQTQFKKLSNPVKIDGNQPAPLVSTLPFVNAQGFELQENLKNGFVDLSLQKENGGQQLSRTNSKQKFRILAKMDIGNSDREEVKEFPVTDAKVAEVEAKVPYGAQEEKVGKFSKETAPENEKEVWMEIVCTIGIVVGSGLITAALLIALAQKKKEKILPKQEENDVKESSETKTESV